MTSLRATYRLQLNQDFTFRHAIALVPYLEALGVSHVYLSPILKAQPGSTHGYDTVDHTVINPELGTEEEFRQLHAALSARDMGIILDFVPNHMGVGGADNPLWLDVLKRGPNSQYADWFDIDWNPPRPGMANKLLVPFLGTSYAEALAGGDLALKADGDGFAVWAYDKEKLPIRPEDAQRLVKAHRSVEAVIEAHSSADKLDELIGQQYWRLSHFAVAPDEINYRRFFINNELAGIRIDREDVFDHAHRLIFRLITEGLVDGLRIDHVDGLRDPTGYLQTLRAKVPRPILLYIEKILAPHEYLRADWPIEGTTGYEVGAQLTRLLTRADGEDAVTRAYTEFVGDVTEAEEEAYRSKLRVMDNELTIELDNLARRAAAIAWSVPKTGDLTQASMRRALREVIARLSVYRTYVEGEPAPRDRREISIALAKARRGQPQVPPAVFDFAQSLLLKALGSGYSSSDIEAILGKFQQYTGPAMAKGLEDTALYRYNRLVSLNEVGAHPDRFSVSIAAFHDANRRRAANHPFCLIATSTHDTKRGEDIRLIISAIADEPVLWSEAIVDWRERLGSAVEKIHPNDLYLFFQQLLGGWPLAGEPEGLADRLKAALEKSVREARQRSDWGVNNEEYEGRLKDLVDAAIGNDVFLDTFLKVQKQFAEIGRRKALIQAVLKMTIPGVPDIYRGAEDWEQSFVDPDNRRPLDFNTLEKRLASPNGEADSKLSLTQGLLHFRREQPHVFANGNYEAFDAGKEVLGFRRCAGGAELTVVVDLSKRHNANLGELPVAGRVILGGPADPFRVTFSER
ncbi:malto-oligosyltrehalose synthase [Devosia soli]|uniref:malto-oligosyltrehalose synthase n=1 Tax=Devosia soli TaxID=361041 RepID=UPI00069C3FF0|nr:malto-oligosyltrehalose synthase [Devosia soli]